MAITTTGMIRASTFAMMKLLSANVPSVNIPGTAKARVYPPGIQEDAAMPRITVSQSTAPEQPAELGASVKSWADVTFSIDIFDKRPGQCDITADEVIQAIESNRNYAPATITVRVGDMEDNAVDPKGQFYMLRISGGSPTIPFPPTQLYRRTVRVAGRWFKSA